jgi:xylulokinase
MRRTNMYPHHLARAAVEGMLCGLADALDELRCQGVRVERVLLIGGAAKAAVVGELAAQIFGTAVTVPRPDEYVALGAARQAAWALSGAPEPPRWSASGGTEVPAPADGGTAGRRVREAYAQARRQLYASR